MIEPGHRGQLGLVSMACAVYQLYAGELAADAVFINCAAGLVRHYRLLGFRTYASRLVPTVDGIEVPLVFIPSDRAYLEQAGSFVAPFADVFYGPGKRAPVDVGAWSSTRRPFGNVSAACGRRRPNTRRCSRRSATTRSPSSPARAS
jgi:hypothetical protein